MPIKGIETTDEHKTRRYDNTCILNSYDNPFSSSSRLDGFISTTHIPQQDTRFHRPHHPERNGRLRLRPLRSRLRRGLRSRLQYCTSRCESLLFSACVFSVAGRPRVLIFVGVLDPIPNHPHLNFTESLDSPYREELARNSTKSNSSHDGTTKGGHQKCRHERGHAAGCCRHRVSGIGEIQH